MSTPTRRTAPACCACAVNGHATADPAIPVMKSRRRISSPKGSGVRRLSLEQCDYSRDLRPTKWGFRVNLHSRNRKARMSALGHKRTLRHLRSMCALPPKRTWIGTVLMSAKCTEGRELAALVVIAIAIVGLLVWWVV